ncbi:diacylglycerol kinase [Candidatus Venteria ishoeyi]|uniref:Diacylglycerol kinase n=1 Tax=Candidatus Venteria ishoeyi TaxID=1899563 RepID=A0A1H6FHM8_9GAMM|nr:diacylglycerol kinase [Candidatus Venteria ishoeyi]MDM8546600.1 diacylglycerol kinase [Candidatus Venteria ishoeyi]SEH08931.1 Diacylglycerol kinase [Candidatus Venteria ishoeyi]
MSGEPEPQRAVKPVAGIQRIINAYGYSLSGLRLAWRSEAAFREEVALLLVGLPLGLWLGETPIEKILLIGVLFLVLIVELLNSAIEAIVDLSSPQYHPLAKQSKDIASAAVFISLLLAAGVWLTILLF